MLADQPTLGGGQPGPRPVFRSEEPCRTQTEQHRTPGRQAASPQAIAKRLRQDPPPFGPQALWEQEQQRLARESLERRP